MLKEDSPVSRQMVHEIPFGSLFSSIPREGKETGGTVTAREGSERTNNDGDAVRCKHVAFTYSGSMTESEGGRGKRF